MSEYTPKPEDSTSRKLVVLLDGTGDSIDDDMSNVGYLKEILYDKGDNKQKVLYVQGLGTAKEGTFKTLTQKALEQAFGANFGDYIVEPYQWLAQNYQAGDKIIIFGFSRGAYAARVLAGMINAVGLLPQKKATETEVRGAYNLYDKFADLPGPPTSAEVREAEWLNLQVKFQLYKQEKGSQEVFIEFLGCWDTVNSVGIVRAIKLGFTRTNDIVRNFRHAMALDEHRVRFKQNNWSGPPKEIPDSADRPNTKTPRCITNVSEVWFAGCHCDIGGGSVINGTRANLAHIPLRWMIREAFKVKSGIIFKTEEIRILGIDPTSIYPEVKPRPEVSSSLSGASASVAVSKPQGWGSYLASFVIKPAKVNAKLIVTGKTEEELDALDALAPAYDQLVLKPYTWGYLETRKEKRERRTPDGKWEEIEEAHNGHGRTIPPAKEQFGGRIKVHRTVRARLSGKLESGDEQYVPLARVGYGPYEEKTLFNDAVSNGWIEWVA